MVTKPEGKNMSSAKWLAVMLLGMIAAACVTWLSMRPAMEAANKLAKDKASKRPDFVVRMITPLKLRGQPHGGQQRRGTRIVA